MTADVDQYHAELAKRYGVRLPRRGSPQKRVLQARFLRQLGLRWSDVTEITGERPGEVFALNPGMDSHEWAGQLLEALHYQGWERPAAKAAAA